MTRTLATGFALACSLAFLGAGARAAAPPPLPPQPKIVPAGIPAGYVLVSPCVRQMGEHWANLKAPLNGTVLYGTYRGQVIFSEVMLTPKDFAAGKSFLDLKPLPGHTIDHVDIQHTNGHPGMEFSHYDIHAYYIPASAVAKICPTAPM
ncbi:MAG TPA: hypothetical protein VIG46_09055 [Candidatus Baltobacteraceae bacterium]|jgi:hypothetical protein